MNGLSGEWHCYPNPAHEAVAITGDRMIPAYIVIRDIAGRQLQRTVPAALSTKLDLNGYAPGIYLVEVNDGQTVHTGRFVVEQ